MGLKSRAVMVAGAGIAGIQAALDLAEMGIKVHLVEESPSIGGRMPQLDKTFPTNDCSMCILSPKMSESVRHPNIKIYTTTTIDSVSGIPGDFTAKIVERAKYIDQEKCVSCGLCEEKCPVKVDDIFDMKLRKRGAVSRYFLQSIPSEYTIDPHNCLYLNKGVCRLCEKVCPAGAINFDDKDKIFEINVGAIILSGGIDSYDPIHLGNFGYRRYKNVVTSLEFERMLSASGPLGGHVVRPGDHKEPKSLAFIQCVGSRDENINHNYCSSACCMFAIKEAMIAKEHIKDLESTVFYMDIRAFGKDFDKYYEKSKDKYGVEYIKSKVSDISEDDDGNLILKYVYENGDISHKQFDMAVLAVGLQPRKSIVNLSKSLNFKLNEFGFCRSDTNLPLATTREGIFVCGAMNGPKDIPESVTAASGAAAETLKFLRLERQDISAEKDAVQEKDVAGDRPRIGAFVCHCGINIAGVVDVKDVAEHARHLPNVEYAEDLIYACSQDCMNTIKERIKEYDLNRIVVAACTPRTHEPLFRETITEAGLNPYLFEMANIRDQCSWAHMNEPWLATVKSKDLMSMGVAKARELKPLKRLPIEINPKAMVIGGGLAGMTTAISLAEAGHEVYLIEKENELGGNLRNIFFDFDSDPQVLLADTISKAESNELIHIYKNAIIKKIDGFVGNFSTTVTGNNKNEEISFDHGVVIIATGADEHVTEEYLYGRSDRIVSQVELEDILKTRKFPGTRKPKNVVMIQCVGSREEGKMYCSRVCCTKAVKNAGVLKNILPNVNIYIIYRDIRTYGFREKHYSELRDKGAMFIHYTPENKPIVELVNEKDTDSQVKVTVFDPIVNKNIEIQADMLVLATAIDAKKENIDLVKMLKVSLNTDGMFLEAHVKLRPVDFATDGIFVAGLAHCPKDCDESITQAKAAASRALTFLNKKAILAEGTICEVNDSRCTGCGYCVHICAYNAIELDPEKGTARVNDALCKGCGACVASCRCGALDLRGFTNGQMFGVFDSLEMTNVIDE
ncbi:MAG: CoB--CoM heterodisulfide reductase iron-sulfur subunit A family protein [Candidatus Delongbacteria bacterium]|nr:CoB--CoM heterodisulfide reductase iron-sulfur subunit A family protein [Candidatus Delongbacteria bacterium]MCG2761303.1 CoB--CoM heterodisulfide reductase iron-sulfur subunit A family protein [Candidatus Delongbacteria bacterium]